MRFRLNILSFTFSVFLGYSCASVQSSKSTTKGNTYSENLSAYRPEVIEEEPKEFDSVTVQLVLDSTSADVTERLNIVLDTVASYSRSTIKYIDGFTIQVYGGDDRAKAKDNRMDLIRHFPESDPKTVFEQPNYKVRVGIYYTRLEAQHFYTQVKQYFPGAILVPTRIYIK